MSEEITNEPTEETVIEPQGEVTETDWKAEARKWEQRAKSAKADTEAAQKWREYEQAQKPVQERLAEELAQAKADASQAASRLLRFEIAAEKGVPNDALDLLNGSSREELESSAEKLLSLIANQSKQTIKPDVNQGKVASGGSSAADQFASALSDFI